jgi:hypothetical protein
MLGLAAAAAAAQIKGFAASLRGDGGAPGFWMKLLGPKGPPPVRQLASTSIQEIINDAIKVTTNRLVSCSIYSARMCLSSSLLLDEAAGAKGATQVRKPVRLLLAGHDHERPGCALRPRAFATSFLLYKHTTPLVLCPHVH